MRRGKFVSFSKKGVRVGVGRHKKQVAKTGCAFLALLLLLLIGAGVVQVTREEFEAAVRDIASLKKANAGLRVRVIALEAQVKELATPAGPDNGATEADNPEPPKPWVLHIRAWIDGHSELVITQGGLRWHHKAYRLPGADDRGKPRFPTYLNGKKWMPQWTGGNLKGENWSQAIRFPVPLPAGPRQCDVTLEPVTVRSAPWHRVVGDRIYVEFRDKPEGAFWYEVSVTVTAKE